MTLTSGPSQSNQVRMIEMSIWFLTDPTQAPPFRLQNKPLISDKST